MELHSIQTQVVKTRGNYLHVPSTGENESPCREQVMLAQAVDSMVVLAERSEKELNKKVND